MKYQILRKETDIAGKIRVWVDIGNSEVQIFKFSKEPVSQEIRSVVDNLLIARQREKEKELEMINQQINDLTKRKEFLEKEVSKL